MNPLVKAQLALEEARKGLQSLLNMAEENRSEGWSSELETARKLVETRQAEVLAVGALEPEIPEHRQETAGGRELRNLLDQANIGKVIGHVLGQNVIDGPEAELQRHFQIPSNAIPLELLETRATATFTGDEEGTARPVVPQVFPQAVADFAGVTMETVPAGQALHPVLSTGATVHAPAQGAVAAESTGAFTITTLTPKRLQAGFSYQIEDAAVLPYMPDSLRMNLSDALASELDKRILTRAPATGVSGGLLTTTVAADPDTPSNANVAADYLAAVYAGVDGLYAGMSSEIRMVVGSTVYAHMGGLAVATGSDINTAQKIAQVSGGIRVSGHVPGYASDFQDALIVKGTPRRNCVAALWQGVRIIMDEVTRSDEGEVKLTAVLMYDFAVLRAAGYARHRFRTA